MEAFSSGSKHSVASKAQSSGSSKISVASKRSSPEGSVSEIPGDCDFTSVVAAAPPPHRVSFEGSYGGFFLHRASNASQVSIRATHTSGRLGIEEHRNSLRSIEPWTPANEMRHFSKRTASKRSEESIHSVIDRTLSKTPSIFFQRRKPDDYFIVKVSRCLVDSYAFVAVTTIFTIYALIGDDIRLLCSEAPSDIVFDLVTLACLSLFTFEIVLSTLGKDDYFLSFFFLLDVVSTVTLFLDLSWVGEWISADEEDLDNVRGSRTARIGARAARIVRVVRLVRIVKLYKVALAVTDTRLKEQERQERAAAPGDDDNEWLKEKQTQQRQVHRESRVSKKLSELTTRRVICLVLLLLLVLPNLTMDESQQFPSSAFYGADVVNEAFAEMLANLNSSSYREAYERALLQYLHYHNWFAKREDCPFDRACPRDYDSHVFWVGISGRDAATVAQVAQLAQVRSTTAATWQSEVSQAMSSESTAWIYTYGAMPQQVQSTLGVAWGVACDSSRYHRRGFSLLAEAIEDQVHYVARCPKDLRRSERQMYIPRLNVSAEAHEAWHFAFFFDTRPSVEKESVFSITVTIFLCFALTFASLLFTSDANNLVLYPVETMMAKVDTIRENPLLAMKVADEELRMEEVRKTMTAQSRQQRKQAKHWLKAVCEMLTCTARESEGELMETVILEKTIIKLGSLLALGFGEAGSKIIEHNMHGVDSACVDAIVEGTRVECIIGATRIKDFSIATEVLQADVMTFVNRIAEIVHGVVDEFHGAANRNNGDTFLIIWRFSDIEDTKVSKLADMAMVAFTKILGAVHRSPVLASYRGHPGLQQRLGRNCRVNLTSGLHAGWAIEGAVGSEFKIDASYLSPNVSVAESVERATQIYGVSILVAESVASMCSPAMATKCRLIDRVILPGSASPMELYVVDTDHMNITVELPSMLQINWTSRQRYRVRQFLEAEKSLKWHGEVQIVSLFNDNTDISTMRTRYTNEFMHVFNMGYQNYVQGEWQVAQHLLSRTKTMLGVEDGPSAALLRFMESPFQFQAPEDWQGIRILEDCTLLA